MVLSFLISNNRKVEYTDYLEKLMDTLCTQLYKMRDITLVDFSVKEVMLAYKLISDLFPEKRSLWLSNLKKIQPYDNYVYTLRQIEKDKLHNINIYNMVGEFLRESEGLTDTEEYFDVHWPMQLERFDNNGMYMDPGCPMLYDITTRCQIQLMLGFGYKGKFQKELSQHLENAGYCTLFMQSSAYELPYGGRSSQYLFNEALIAANCEFEAKRHKDVGNLKLAGMYKRSAHLATKSIQRWLNDGNETKHIKNFYSIESKYGTENYGYYNKYMITLGCFIYIAYLFADDEIEEFACPAELGGYVVETSDTFHKIFANINDNFIEIDTKADFHYDATGMGRYHKTGFPTELALSIPFTNRPNYNLSKHLKTKNISICTGWEDEYGNINYLSDLNVGLEHELKVIKIDDSMLCFEVMYFGECFNDIKGVKESYKIDKEGIKITAEIINPCTKNIFFQVPLFHYNGQSKSMISSNDCSAKISSIGCEYEVTTNGHLDIDYTLYGNRNGEYYVANIKCNNKPINVKLGMHK